jgi:hypothetical protein
MLKKKNININGTITNLFVFTQYKIVLISIVLLIMITIAPTNVNCFFECKEGEDGLFEDEIDCWVYHICDGGTHIVRACEEDLFFNSETGLCDWPMNVKCKSTESKIPFLPTAAASPLSSDEKTSKKQNEKYELNTNANTKPIDIDKLLNGDLNTVPLLATENTNIQITDSQIVNSKNFGCKSSDYGYKRHPTDCRKYIYCQEGKTKIFTCQGGLLWKQADGNCVWPLDSDCKLNLFKL